MRTEPDQAPDPAQRGESTEFIDPSRRAKPVRFPRIDVY